MTDPAMQERPAWPLADMLAELAGQLERANSRTAGTGRLRWTERRSSWA